MITLSKIPYTDGNGNINTVEDLEGLAAAVYKSEGLHDMLKAGDNFNGWITVEPTTGHYNYNPKSKLAAVRYYKYEPQTRRGFYAKLQIMTNGDLMSK